MDAGTSLATAALAPGAAELDAAVPVPVLVPDDEVGAAAADDVDDVVLLLPHPTIAAAHSSGTAADSHVLIERIALLLIESQKLTRRIGKIALAGRPS
jgi:hypothetical protein